MNDAGPYIRQNKRAETASKRVTAEVISCPGRLWDDAYSALQINVDGFESPYVLTLALRALAHRAFSEQNDPIALYQAIATALNNANVTVQVAHSKKGRTT